MSASIHRSHERAASVLCILVLGWIASRVLASGSDPCPTVVNMLAGTVSCSGAVCQVPQGNGTCSAFGALQVGGWYSPLGYHYNPSQVTEWSYDEEEDAWTPEVWHAQNMVQIRRCACAGAVNAQGWYGFVDSNDCCDIVLIQSSGSVRIGTIKSCSVTAGCAAVDSDCRPLKHEDTADVEAWCKPN